MKKIIKKKLKNHSKLIIFMPSMEGGGVEKYNFNFKLFIKILR